MSFWEDLQDSWNNLWSGGGGGRPNDRDVETPEQLRLKINQSNPSRARNTGGQRIPGPGADRTQIRTPLRGNGGKTQIRTPLNLSERNASRPPMQSDPSRNLRNMMDQRTAGLTGGNNVMDDLLAKIAEGYGGPSDDSDYGRQAIMSALDSALGGALGGINKARGSANSSFQTSDKNVADMHSAFQQDIRTRGKDEFNDISNDLVGGLKGNRQEAVGELSEMENRDRAERVAMLKSLGIEEAGGAPESRVYDEAASDITERTNLGTTAGEEQRAGNLSYNEGLATTTGLQGMSRRAELTRQLQAIMGGLDSSEAEVRTQDARARAAAEGDIEQNRQRAHEQDYSRWEGEQDNLRGLLDQMQSQEMDQQDRAYERDMWEQEQAMKQSQFDQKNAPGAPEVDGFASIANNLANSGIEQGTASQAISLLSRGAAEGVFERDSSFSGKIKYLIDNGIPDSVALQVVTDYANL